MNRHPLITVLLVAVATCAGQLRAASVADEPVDESLYTKSSNCIATASIRHVTIIDVNHIVLELRGGKYVLNQLRQSCLNLNPDNVMQFNTMSQSLCNLDRLDVLQRGGGLQRIGSCSLGRFEEITKAQMLAIMESVQKNHSSDFWKWVQGK